MEITMYNQILIYVTFASIAPFIYTQHFIDKKGSPYNNPWVYNAHQAFNYIPVKTKDYIKAWTYNMITPPDYTQECMHRYQGIWDNENHFTAIKRLPVHLGLGEFLAVVGTNPHIPASQLFIVNIQSQDSHGSFKKNCIKREFPANDAIISKTIISKEYWHSGGMDMCGKYLAVAVSKDSSSKIVFYDMSNPTVQHLSPLNVEIVHNHANAYAIALTRLKDKHYICAIWTGETQAKQNGTDFYYSKSTNLIDGFDDSYTLHIPATSIGNYKKNRAYKNMNFVTDLTGKLYLIATENDGLIDHADLIEISIATVTQQMIDKARRINVKRLLSTLKLGKKMIYMNFQAEKHMYCKYEQCNFNAGATIYIPDQQHIYIYAQPFWLTHNGKQMTFAQYASIQKTYPG